MKIEKLPSGTYRCRIYLGKDQDGKKHWKSFTDSDKTRLKRIAAEYADTHREYQQEDFAPFEASANAYIALKKAVLSPYTIKTYEDNLRVLKSRCAAFCALRTADVNAQNLQSVINTLVMAGKRPKYVRNIYGLITAVMSSNGYTLPKVTLPENTRQDLHEPTTDEIRQVLTASEGTALEIPILLGVHGLRRGEICALRYPEDFDGNTVHVRKSAVYLGKGQRIDKAPKNQQSDRIVPISPDLAGKIARQGYVVRCQPQTLTGSFRKFLQRNDLPIFRFHDLRHYFAAYMHQQGLTDEEIMALGGWKTDHTMKRVYRYGLSDGTSDKMSSAIQKLFEAKS